MACPTTSARFHSCTNYGNFSSSSGIVSEWTYSLIIHIDKPFLQGVTGQEESRTGHDGCRGDPLSVLRFGEDGRGCTGEHPTGSSEGCHLDGRSTALGDEAKSESQSVSRGDDKGITVHRVDMFDQVVSAQTEGEVLMSIDV